MSSALAKLNLRPQERRLVVVVGIVLFVVLNVWLIWPHFTDWSQVQQRRQKAEKTLSTYSAEVAKTKAYQVKLRELESAGSTVLPEEQELDFVRTVLNQAQLSKLYVAQSDPRPRVSANTQTNRFFEEQYETLHVTSGNEELVNFLVSLASTNSLIRVKDLTLKLADPTKLDAAITLVASYKRAAPARARTPAATPALATAEIPKPKPAVPNQIRTPTRAERAAAANLGITNKLASSKARATNAPAKK